MNLEFRILNYELKLKKLKISLDFLFISIFCFTFVNRT